MQFWVMWEKTALDGPGGVVEGRSQLASSCAVPVLGWQVEGIRFVFAGYVPKGHSPIWCVFYGEGSLLF